MWLSIIIPIYNYGQYVHYALDSIYAQELGTSEFEVIAVNDGSTDDSLNVLQRYAQNHPNMKVVSQNNQGISAARNRGMKECLGDYIHFFDADDSINLGSYRLLYDVIKNNPQADILQFDYIEVSERIKSSDYRLDTTQSVVESKESILQKKMIPYIWNRVYKRDFLAKNNIFFKDFSPAEDTVFNVDVLCCNPKVLKVNADIYIYYVHPGSVVTTKDNITSKKQLPKVLAYGKYLKEKKATNVLFPQNFEFDSLSIGIFSRLIKAELSFKEIKEYYKEFSDIGLLPAKAFGGIKGQLIHILSSNMFFMFVASCCYSMKKYDYN